MSAGVTVLVNPIDSNNKSFEITVYENTLKFTVSEDVMLSTINNLSKSQMSMVIYLYPGSVGYASILQLSERSIWVSTVSEKLKMIGTKGAKFMSMFYCDTTIENLLSVNIGDPIIDINSNERLLNSNRFVTLPLIRYILSIPYAIPVAHIILGERPYATDIFPYAASAMSFDPTKENFTPSVHFLALGVSNDAYIDYNTARDWFRDSWKYLTHGIIALNVCTLQRFMDNDSELERVAVERFLKDIINVSRLVSPNSVHIYAMGNPARHSASRIKSSIKDAKRTVLVHDCNNPAMYQHKVCDQWSHTFTLNKPALTRLLAGLITITSGSDRCVTSEDYYKMASGDKNELNNLIGRGSNMVDIFDSIESYFKANHGTTVQRDEELFGRASKEMREFILALQSSRIQLLFSELNEPKGTSKQSYYNSRSSYSGRNFKAGSSSKLSSTPGSGRKQKIGFADEDEGETAETRISTSRIAGHSKDEPMTPVSTTPVTPSRPPPSATKNSAAKSTVSRGSTHVGFVDDSEEDSKDDVFIETPSKVSGGISTDNAMTPEEISDLAFVCDFINDNAEKYKVETMVLEFLDSARQSKRASPGVSWELLEVIRKMRVEIGESSVADALGYTGKEVDVTSDVVQWIVNLKP
ncbi:hypothetical protein LOZ61_006779 [Ophidiomyces ophidiicola]|nr:hypothetical protein LOZ61_006779 [Ophidiomyces ophidiicola]